jgi:hypothetical protein
MIAMKADYQLKISPDLKIKFSGSFNGLPFPSKVYHFPQIQKSRDLAVNCSTSDLCFSLRDSNYIAPVISSWFLCDFLWAD